MDIMQNRVKISEKYKYTIAGIGFNGEKEKECRAKA